MCPTRHVLSGERNCLPGISNTYLRSLSLFRKYSIRSSHSHRSRSRCKESRLLTYLSDSSVLVSAKATNHLFLLSYCCKSADAHKHATSHGSSSALPYTRGSQRQQSKEKDDDLVKKLDKKFLSVHMYDFAHQDRPAVTFILLEHSYNIPSVKYKCVDHGMLEHESLNTLRFHYVQHLTNSWRLTSNTKEQYGRS